MNTIKCTHCGLEVELSEALTKDIEKTLLAAEHEKHLADIERIKVEIQDKATKDAALRLDLKLQSLATEAEEAKKDSQELREQLKGLMVQLRESNKARANAEIDMQKKLAIEESKIREEASRSADERQRLNLAAKEKTITDLQKALDDAQRKAAQGSQQLQGEIMELDFEEALAGAFRDDEISPVAKGTKGGDILQTVKSPRGVVCGVILWEIKRTKNWTEGWIAKLKEDARNVKANISIIITEVMPKEINEEMGQRAGVWICKPKLAVILGTLLRKALLDAGYQRALAENRGGQAEALYSFITSHEFIQQIESMVETYQDMAVQVTRERTAYERLWALREKQAQKLLLGTSNIIGSMQGHIGQASMPKIKGLDLLDSSEDYSVLDKIG